jgi:hypothetical protein
VGIAILKPRIGWKDHGQCKVLVLGMAEAVDISTCYGNPVCLSGYEDESSGWPLVYTVMPTTQEKTKLKIFKEDAELLKDNLSAVERRISELEDGNKQD